MFLVWQPVNKPGHGYDKTIALTEFGDNINSFQGKNNSQNQNDDPHGAKVCWRSAQPIGFFAVEKLPSLPGQCLHEMRMPGCDEKGRRRSSGVNCRSTP